METVFKMLEKAAILKPFLKLISEGKFFSKAFAILLLVVMILSAVGFVYVFINSLGIFRVNVVMGIITELLVIVFFYILINILLVRAEDINRLEESKDYIVIPVSVVLIKMIGEIMAALTVVFGIYITFAKLLGAGAMIRSFPGAPMIGGILAQSGYWAFAAGIIAAFIVLVFFYLVAELAGVLVDIARNTRK